MELKIETDLNDKTHLIKYDNDDGLILFSGSVNDCLLELKKHIKDRHRITHYTYGNDKIIDHKNDTIKNSKEFFGF